MSKMHLVDYFGAINEVSKHRVMTEIYCRFTSQSLPAVHEMLNVVLKEEGEGRLLGRNS
jgi:hypothetical protein